MKLGHINHLAWAVDEAEGWRGNMTGNPDEGPLEQFDATIKICRQALTEARRDRRTITAQKKRIAELEDRVRGLSAS